MSEPKEQLLPNYPSIHNLPTHPFIHNSESHWPYQGGNSTFLGEMKKKRKKKNPKMHKKVFFLNVCCVFMFYVFLCCSVCWFLYGPFCHGALKLDISTLFTTFFSKHFFILYYYLIYQNYYGEIALLSWSKHNLFKSNYILFSMQQLLCQNTATKTLVYNISRRCS